MSSHPAEKVRQEQLHSLLEQLVRASKTPGFSGNAVIYGPPTHSIERFVTDAITAFKDQGHLCLEGSCENVRGEPFRAFSEIVDQALRHIEERGESTPISGVLASFGWALEGRPGSTVNDLLGRNSRLDLLEALRRLLLHVAHSQSTVIVIRHLDHADEDTVELLCDLLDHCALSGTHRDLGGERTCLPPVILELPLATEESHRIQKRLEAMEGVTPYPVEGLDREALEQWLTSDGVVDRFHALTHGDPLRMKALLHALPADMEDLVTRRYCALPDEGKIIAQTLALTPRPLETSHLRAACALTELELARGIASLQTGGLLQTLPGERLTLLDGQDWIRTQLSDDKAVAIHEALGVHFSSCWTQTQDEGLLEQAAHHFMATGNRERSIAFCLQAGAELQRRFRLHAARNLYRTLLNWSPPQGSALVAWSRLAEVCTALDRIEEASEALENVLELAHDDADPATLIRLGEMQLKCGHVQLATDSLKTALSLFGTEHKELEVKARLALSQVCLVSGNLDEAWNQTAHASLENHPEALLIRGNTLFRKGKYEDANTCYAQVAAEEDSLLQVRANHNRGLIAIRTGRYSQAVRHLQESQRVAEACGSYFGVAISQVNLGIAYEHMERFALSEKFLIQAAALFERLGRRTNLISTLSSLADLRLRFGHPRSARRLLLKAMNMSQAEGNAYETEWARMKMGLVESTRKRWGKAEGCIRQAADYFSANGHQEDLGWATLYLAQNAMDRGLREACIEHLSSLEDLSLAPEHEISGLGLVVEARLKATEEPEEALSILEDALANFTSLRQREPQVVCWSLMASIYGTLGDSRQSHESARTAADILDSLKLEVPMDLRARFLRRAVFSEVLHRRDHVEQVDAEQVIATHPVDTVISHDIHHTGMIGTSKSLVRAIAAAKRLAKTDAPVLLLGESGTGKERFAELMYQTSKRKGQPFVRVNAAALPDTLLESELFGHEKGAFTGASSRRRGKFEQASGGVLFLDEIGDISPKTQVSLLRVLEEKRFQRLGGHQDLRADVRLIFATNRNLEDAVARGEFRLDLYHRISGLSLPLPPLRERGEDVLLLAEHFLRILNEEQGQTKSLSPCAKRVLLGHRWPGNIREVENIIRSGYLLHDGDMLTGPILREFTGIGVADYSMVPEQHDEMNKVQQWDAISLDGAKRQLEVNLISQALTATDGNITKAAALLKMKRPRLSQKIKEYGIRVKRGSQERQP